MSKNKKSKDSKNRDKENLTLGIDDKEETEKPNFQDNLNKNVEKETDEVLKNVLDDFLEEGPEVRKTCSFYILKKIDDELEKQVKIINRKKAEKGEEFKKMTKGQLLEKILIKTLNLE